MPKCDKCKEFFPSDMCDVLSDGKHLCHFCKKETNVLFGENNITFVKGEVVLDYKKFVAELASNPSLATKITNLTVENAINKMKKEA